MSKNQRTPNKARIKRDYLAGMTPAELAEKYKLPNQKIRDMAAHGKWAQEKKAIIDKVAESVVKSETDAILAMKRQERADMYLLIEGARKQLAAREQTMYRLESATSVMVRAYERLYKSFGIADKVNLNDDPDKPMFLKVIW
jgi:hypothetical protein